MEKGYLIGIWKSLLLPFLITAVTLSCLFHSLPAIIMSLYEDSYPICCLLENTNFRKQTILLNLCLHMKCPIHTDSLHTISTLWGRSGLLIGGWYKSDIHYPRFFV